MRQQFHYRYIDTVGEYGVSVELVRYLVLRETPKGFWVSRIWGFFFDNENPEEKYHDPQYHEDDKVWVSKTSTKRKAYPTKEEAYTNFLYRKRRQVKILSARLRNAEDALKIAETKRPELLHCESAKLERPSKLPRIIAF